MNPYDVLKRPLVTERVAALQKENNLYAFEIDKGANKRDVKSAVEAIFPNVKVVAVKTQVRPGKVKRQGRSVGEGKDWKRALVTLRKGDKIEGLEVT